MASGQQCGPEPHKLLSDKGRKLRIARRELEIRQVKWRLHHPPRIVLSHFSSAYTIWPHWDTLLFEFLILFAGLYRSSTSKKASLRPRSSSPQPYNLLRTYCVVIGIAQLTWWIQAAFLDWFYWHWLLWAFYLAAFAFTVGRWLAGIIFGLTLMITCRYFDMNHNDAFSAMQLDSHRHFLRIRMLGDKLTIFSDQARYGAQASSVDTKYRPEGINLHLRPAHDTGVDRACD